MGPPSFMLSVVDRNVVMRLIPAFVYYWSKMGSSIVVLLPYIDSCRCEWSNDGMIAGKEKPKVLWQKPVRVLVLFNINTIRTSLQKLLHRRSDKYWRKQFTHLYRAFCYYKSFFLLSTDAQENCFYRSIKIYIKITTALTCFGVVKMWTKCFNTVTLASSHSTLPDDGDHTETCWSYCNLM